MKMEVNGVTYNVEIEGAGEPLVLLHGFTGSIATWIPFLSEWKKSFQLILIDIIGHGKTDTPEDFHRYSMEHSVQDMLAIVTNLNLAKVNVLGYSMGGRLALSCAINYPTRIKKLILESSSPGIASEEDQCTRRKSDARLAENILEKGIENFVDYWENIPLFSSQKVLSEEQKLSIRSERLKNNAVGLANSLKGMGTGSQPSWWDLLSLLDLPVLLVCGKLDSKYCQIANEMNSLMPYSSVYEVDGVGHTIHVEKPRIFGRIVNEFFKGGNIHGK